VDKVPTPAVTHINR